MTRQEALMQGLIITEFADEKEQWAHRKRPIMYPYEYWWFSMLPKDERSKYGIKLEDS